MITLRRGSDRGRTRFDWLDSRHTFSFGDYFDPQQMGYSDLRVINEDRVAPGGGFPTHSHRDMEIVTYVLEGALAHKDSTGASSVIRAGDVQRMSAGRGITHSEYNASQTDAVHFLQIWILPERAGLAPGYEQRSFDLHKNSGRWALVAAPDARDGAVKIHQDAALRIAALPQGGEVSYSAEPRRRLWAQIVRGQVNLNEVTLNAGDGAAVSNETTVGFRAAEPSEILLFDLR